MTTQRLGHYISSSVFMARSPVLASPADDTYQVIQIPRKSFLMDVWLYVSTAYSGALGTITLGYTYNGSSDADGIMTNDVAKPLVAGTKRAIRDNLASIAEGTWCTAGNLIITATCDDAGGTAGTFYVIASYFILN